MPIIAIGKNSTAQGSASTLDGKQQMDLMPAKRHTRTEDYALRKKIFEAYLANKSVQSMDLCHLGIASETLRRHYLIPLRALEQIMYEKNPEEKPLCLADIMEAGGNYKYKPWLDFLVNEGKYTCTMKGSIPHYAPAEWQSKTPPVKHQNFADVVEGMYSGKRETRKQADKSSRLDVLYQAYKKKVQAWAVAAETPIGYMPRTIGKYLKAFRELDDIVGRKWATESEILENSHNILCITKAVLKYRAGKGHYKCKEENGIRYYKRAG